MSTKRPIKFRVWDVENAKYLENEVMWSVAGVPQEMLPGQPPFIPFVTLAIAAPETKYVVEQFTGQIDKNGVEVYEGDIIESEVHAVVAGVIRYNSKAAIYQIEGKDDSGGPLSCYNLGTSSYIVVGNVHQNENLPS